VRLARFLGLPIREIINIPLRFQGELSPSLSGEGDRSLSGLGEGEVGGGEHFTRRRQRSQKAVNAGLGESIRLPYLVCVREAPLAETVFPRQPT